MIDKHYFVIKTPIYMVSLIDFINSIAELDDIQDASAWTLAEKWPFSTGWGGGRPTILTPLRYGPVMD